MRSSLISGIALGVAALALATNPAVVEAAGLVTGKDVKDGSLTGKDVRDGSLTGKDLKESSLAPVPTAGRLTPLRSGETQSGAFGMAGTTAGGSAEYLAAAITFPKPLTQAIPVDQIIDTDAGSDPEHCPDPGQAAPGYLCLYFDFHQNVEPLYANSQNWVWSASGTVHGINLYAVVTGEGAYADGIWTYTAP